MYLFDVNVLLYAHKEQCDDHAAHNAFLSDTLAGPSCYGMSEMVLSSFVRIATHPKIFDMPSTLSSALLFAKQVMAPENCVLVRPGKRHWRLFCDLAENCGARGNLIADAYLAALAIEHGCEWVTTDNDFARFPGLRWRHPLAK